MTGLVAPDNVVGVGADIKPFVLELAFAIYSF
jgi:hypothetical protein